MNVTIGNSDRENRTEESGKGTFNNMKVAQYVANFLAERKVEHIFSVTGGGAMHLNDAFGHHDTLTCIFNHHEQACAMAAEGYARLIGKVAAVCVTSGPGGTNALTGVMGGWLDSIPMFIVSGQVKRETTTWSTDVGVRQLGDQEFQIVDCVKTMTKYAHMVTEPESIRYHLEKAWYLCNNGRKGPVWLDIPLDVQAAVVEPDTLEGFSPDEHADKEYPAYDETVTPRMLELIGKAKRPVILAGTGIRLGGACDEFLGVIERLGIPVLTEWNGHDLLWDEHPLYCGRPGSLGTRGGNFIVQNSDLLVVFGSRLNIRQIGYNYQAFARNAYKIVVDIDAAELRKPTVKIDFPVHADIKEVLQSMLRYDVPEGKEAHQKWLQWCRGINKRYPAVLPQYYAKQTPVNPYVFIEEFSQCLSEKEKIICGNGSACVVTFQGLHIRKGQRLFTNSGCAAMGYGFPAAIGACIAEGNKRTVCIDGDGSFQMNLQELQTVVYHQLNLKTFILNNNGYHSIRQTQINLFRPPLVGVCDGNGISFPDLEKIAYAYEIPYYKIQKTDEVKKVTAEVMDLAGPVICEVIIDPAQNFEPKISSRVLSDGSIVSPEIDDMFPFLPRDEYEANRKVWDIE